MAGYIEDRWLTKKPDPVTGKRRRTALYGKGKRYKVAGIPGVRGRSFDIKADAETWKAQALTDSRRQEFIDPRKGSITVREFVESIWWPARRDPVGTAGPMKSKIWNHILPHIGDVPMNAVDREHLEKLIARQRDAGLEDGTIGVLWIHGTSIFKTAVGKRVVRNPFSVNSDLKPKPPRRKARAWTADEARTIRSALHERYRVSVDLGIAAGLRQGETFGFSLEDIDEANGLIHLRRQLLWDPGKPYFKLPKGGKERDIPLSPGLLKAVLAHAEEFPPVEVTLPWRGPGNSKRPTLTVELLIVTAFHNPVNATTFNKVNFKPALAAAGAIAPFDPGGAGSGWEPSRDKMHHRWRHTYASVQLAAGEDVVSLSHWMGHSSPKVTFDTYAHFMPDKGQRGRTAVDAWLSAGRD